MSENLPQSHPGRWKSTSLLIGGALGLLAGLASAYLYNRSAEENNGGQPPGRISTGDMFRLALAAIALIRQISDLGAGRQSKSRSR